MESSTIQKETGTTQSSVDAIADKKAKLQRSRDLAERAALFAQNVRAFVRKTPKTISSIGDCRRIVRCSGEIGAAYLDADKSLTRNEFIQCIRDCCRESRQSQHWLRLLDVNLDERGKKTHAELLQEANELERIFGAILHKVKEKN